MAIRENEVITGEGRLSYIRFPGDNGKYSLTFLLPKADTATAQALKEAESYVRTRYNEGRTSKINLKSAVHDGDGERPNGGEYGEECKGHWVVNCSTTRPPKVFKASMQELDSGDYARLKLGAYSYDRDGNKGIAMGLQGIAFTRKGEPLYSTASAADFGLGEEEDFFADVPF
jgi:hypothetical protein